jgi:flagellar M-ring protein FliF
MKTILSDFSNFWSALEANQKVSLFLATVILIAGSVGISIWANRPEMRLLYGGLDEKQAASIVQHLEGASVPYEIRYGGSAVFVPQKEVYKARMDIAASGVTSNGSVGFEIFDKNSFGASDFIQRTNFIRAIQGELSRTIAQLSSVQSARVMVVMPENRLLVAQRTTETTASVFVDVGGSSLSQHAVAAIQALVANSVEGLVKSKVTVVDNNGKVLSNDEDEDSMVAASSAILRYRQSVENYFSAKVESMLERALGAGNATVRVHAEIDSEQFTKSEEVYNDESSALLSSVTEEESSTSSHPNSGVTVGVEGAGAAAKGSGTSEEDRRMRDQQYAVDRTVTNTSRAAGTIRRLTASVFVSSKTEASEDGAPTEAVARSAVEIDQLRNIVAKALGIDLDDPASGAVEVQEMPFLAGASTALAVAVEDTGGFDPAELMKFGSEIVGSALALILFVIFMVMYRKTKDQPSPFEQMEHMAATVQSGGRGASQITPDLLNQLISQRPDNTAASIKTWLQDVDEG